MHAVFHCYLLHIHTQQMKTLTMKSQFLLSVSSIQLRNIALPRSLFYKQETEQQEVKASVPKVVQEANMKLDGG